jgi:hypothetical protein
VKDPTLEENENVSRVWFALSEYGTPLYTPKGGPSARGSPLQLSHLPETIVVPEGSEQSRRDTHPF